MSEYETGSQFLMSREALAEADRDTQLEIMETWFRDKFEDPANSTPYESAEGGYIWIWGGPYDAHEELDQEFGDIVPMGVVEELVKKLEEECVEWAPTSNNDDYDESLIEDLAQITEYYHNFSGAILDIEELLETEVEGSAAPALHRLLFVNVITAMETYLSDAFISIVLNDKELMRRFIETTPEFQSEKMALSDVFKAIEKVEKRAKDYLIDVVWHHLNRAKRMYQDTLEVEFPLDMEELFRAVRLRHDIVHRNGKTKEGKEILVTVQNISELIREVESFAQHIDKQIAEKKEQVSGVKEKNEGNEG